MEPDYKRELPLARLGGPRERQTDKMVEDEGFYRNIWIELDLVSIGVKTICRIALK